MRSTLRRRVQKRSTKLTVALSMQELTGLLHSQLVVLYSRLASNQLPLDSRLVNLSDGWLSVRSHIVLAFRLVYVVIATWDRLLGEHNLPTDFV